MRQLAAVLALASAWLLAPRALTDVEFRTDEIADSGGYFLYSYVLTNPSRSSGLVDVEMDVSASSGTPALLTTTGDFFDRSAGTLPRAEIGPLVPAGWEGYIYARAKLTWGFPYFVSSSSDSLAPGDSASGFGIRSGYLPGLRQMVFRPTVESCCAEPVDSTEEEIYASPFDHELSGWSIGPRYVGADVDLDLIESQRATVCEDPEWISSATICGHYEDSLAVSVARLGINNYEGALTSLGGMSLELNGDRPSADMRDNAYWLLKTNVDYFRGMLPDTLPLGGVSVCLESPVATRAKIGLHASGGALIESDPHTMEAEVTGVDPSGSSCTGLWTIIASDTVNVAFTAQLDSIDAGLEVDSVYIFGGLDGDTTLVGDSVTTLHDGITYATIIIGLKQSQQ